MAHVNNESQGWLSMHAANPKAEQHGRRRLDLSPSASRLHGHLRLLLRKVLLKLPKQTCRLVILHQVFEASCILLQSCDPGHHLGVLHDINDGGILQKRFANYGLQHWPLERAKGPICT